jgi:hypothetical protein
MTERLRHVAIRPYAGDYPFFTLETWETGTRAPYGQEQLGYRFKQVEPDGTARVIFEGTDFGCSPMDAIDSNGSLRSLLGFLTLRPGDTDPEYFEDYTAEQLAFADEHAESLSIWSTDPDEGEDPPGFEDLD